MVFTIMASLAQLESILVSEQVKAAIAHTKAQNKPMGCPPVEAAGREKIR